MGKLILTPPYAWAGNKMEVLDKVLERIPKTDRFVDVCGGSGVVMLNVEEHEFEVFNDINKYIVNFYQVIQSREMLDRLITKLQTVPYSRELFLKYCHDKRVETDPVEIAFAWYYSIRTSFSQLGRHYGRSLTGNTETRRIWEKIPLFEYMHARLRKVYIENKDCFTLISDYDSYDTVFYVDPPYVNTPVGAYPNMMTYEGHKKLLDLIFKSKGTFVVSGEPDPLYDEYGWAETFQWSISGKVNNGSRRRRQECLWVKA